MNAHNFKDIELKKILRKNDTKHEKKIGRRSQSLDRIVDDNSGDSREERRNRRQYMHLVSKYLQKIEYFMRTKKKNELFLI